MKYILRTLWVIGLIPASLLALTIIAVFMFVVIPIVAAFIFIKTGKLEDDDILLLNTVVDWLWGKYSGLLDKIK